MIGPLRQGKQLNTANQTKARLLKKEVMLNTVMQGKSTGSSRQRQKAQRTGYKEQQKAQINPEKLQIPHKCKAEPNEQSSPLKESPLLTRNA